jgi:sugar/nucleoside kinase (ribokinase family)
MKNNMPKKISVSGVGCCLVDVLYNNVDFSAESVKPFLSNERGDGGLMPGQLVFLEDLVSFGKSPFEAILNRITHVRSPDKINIGGPAVVPLIHLAQLTSGEECTVRFYGRGGSDENGTFLKSELGKTPVILQDYELVDGYTPSTFVLSDPNYDHGHGERMFVNTIGAANAFLPEYLQDDFFNSSVVVFGGTALVPSIHDHLGELLRKSKLHGAITVVNTVFDFRNEKLNPDQKWPLGGENSYQSIDLLVTDHEEALRLSGTKETRDACSFFVNSGLSAFIITNGSKDLCYWSDGRLFAKQDLATSPVSRQIVDELKINRSGDTTGCGDNFVGGVLYSVVEQLKQQNHLLDLSEACAWGVVSGGFTCFYVGGTYHETARGEKLANIKPYYSQYIARNGN